MKKRLLSGVLAFAMLFGIIIVPIVSLFTKKPDEKHVEEVFSCINLVVFDSSVKV